MNIAMLVAMATDDKLDSKTRLGLADRVDLLRAQLGDIDALAAAANELIDAVPFVADPNRRRRLDHLVALVSLVADRVRVVVDEATKLSVDLVAGGAGPARARLKKPSAR